MTTALGHSGWEKFKTVQCADMNSLFVQLLHLALKYDPGLCFFGIYYMEPVFFLFAALL